MIRRRAPLLPVAFLAAFGALASLVPGTPAAPACAAAGPHHAALVVEHGDGSTTSRCVAFAGASISGEELLNRSGLAWSSQTFGGFGDAVCALDGEPAHYADCPGKDRYWAVFFAPGGGAWQLTSVGISSLTVHDGDAEGFRFVPSSGTPAAPPSAAGVCVAPAPRQSVAGATATPASFAASAVPSSSATSSAAATVSASATDSPATASPAPTATPRTPAPAPAPPGGADPGLLATAVVGGGLAGLAILRLVARRRGGP